MICANPRCRRESDYFCDGVLYDIHELEQDAGGMRGRQCLPRRTPMVENLPAANPEFLSHPVKVKLIGADGSFGQP